MNLRAGMDVRFGREPEIEPLSTQRARRFFLLFLASFAPFAVDELAGGNGYPLWEGEPHPDWLEQSACPFAPSRITLRAPKGEGMGSASFPGRWACQFSKAMFRFRMAWLLPLAQRPSRIWRLEKPTIRGLCYSVEWLLETLSSGMTSEEVPADYEDMEPADIQAVLFYAARLSQVNA